jgi:hypothetical protein
LKEKKSLKKMMGPLPDHRVGPCPIFRSVAVELFGPIKSRGTVNKRLTRKRWGVMFICTAPSEVQCTMRRHIFHGQLRYGPHEVHVCKGDSVQNLIW